jgi:predicted dithiol-disulfide oxidoreductase (DUF899 family)/uncharacterized protein YndB with AHSA1/START domain
MTAKTAAGAFAVQREIHIDAPRERVFELLSSRDRIASWMPATTFEPHVGGKVAFTFAPEGVDWLTIGQVTEFEPPERVAFTWDHPSEPLGAVTEIRFELTPDEGGTRVRLTHTGFVSEEQQIDHDGGWTYFLDRLKVAGEGGTPEIDGDILASRHREAMAELLGEELALRDEVERVAALRRAVPLGPAITKEYAFHADKNTTVTLPELFGKKDNLLVYHLMFHPDDEVPCPMCSLWIDGLNAIAWHVRPRAELVVIAKAPTGKLTAYAKKRGWDKVRVLSSYGTTFNRDFRAEDGAGDQVPAISAFRRTSDGIHHFYQKFAANGDTYRGIDLYTPVWNLFDLLPDGRGEGNAQHVYPE